MINGSTARKPARMRTYSPLLVLSILSLMMLFSGGIIGLIGENDSTGIITNLCFSIGKKLTKLGAIIFLPCASIYCYRWFNVPVAKEKSILKNKNLRPWLYGMHLYVESMTDTSHIIYPDCLYNDTSFSIAILPGLHTKLEQASHEVEDYLNSLGFHKMVIGHHVKNGWMIYEIIDDYHLDQLNSNETFNTHNNLVKITNNLNWDFLNNPNALITGPRNSGKSWLLFSFIWQMAFNNAQLFLVDPKKVIYSS